MRIHKRGITQTVSLVIALAALITWAAAPTTNSAGIANTTTSASNPLIGIWDMTVQGELGTYHYKYTISEGSWVASGNIDPGLFNFQYGPTLGTYVKNDDGSYRYREIGWTYTRGGVCNGSFESIGTFILDAPGNTFSGPGTFKQFDLTGKTILTENLTVVATKLPV